MTKELPNISVVVIGRNEGLRLARCLESVQTANYATERIELIYVDTSSTDDSRSMASKAGAKVLAIHPERPCAAAARNAGLRRAQHGLVQFLDGDTIVAPSWFGKAVVAMKNQAVGCVFGRVEEIARDASIYNFWAHHDWYVPPGPAESCGGNALYRRNVLEAAGGFDETLIAGEEADLCYRIRRDQQQVVLSLDEPMVRHDIDMTRFAQYWKRCVRTGHAYAEVGGRHRGMHRWRVARWRNLAYALGTPLAAGLSFALSSILPLAVWVGWVALAIMRNAWGLRRQVGSLGGALLYSSHHYLSKTPSALGQCLFWVRSALGRKPQTLIEYR